MKKTVQALVDSSNPKLQKNLQKAFENGCGSQYYDAFRAEVLAGSVTDFPKLSAAVTASYVCFYATFGWIAGSSLEIIPLDQIDRVYRCNLVNGEYRFDNIFLVAETKDGKANFCFSIFRNQKPLFNTFDELIRLIRSRLPEQTAVEE